MRDKNCEQCGKESENLLFKRVPSFYGIKCTKLICEVCQDDLEAYEEQKAEQERERRKLWD